MDLIRQPLAVSDMEWDIIDWYSQEEKESQKCPLCVILFDFETNDFEIS